MMLAARLMSSVPRRGDSHLCHLQLGEYVGMVFTSLHVCECVRNVRRENKDRHVADMTYE
jgi:hypothetical protein